MPDGLRWQQPHLKSPVIPAFTHSCIHSACISPNCVSGSVLFFSRTFDWETQLLPAGGILGTLCGRCCEGPSDLGTPVSGEPL